MNFDNLPWQEQSNKWWDYNLERENSIITEIFTGQLMNKIQCQKCNAVSLAFDNFMDLSLSIPRGGMRIIGKIELQACLRAFIQEEKMEACGYKCQKCKYEDKLTK